MTDLEKTRLCAEAMGIPVELNSLKTGFWMPAFPNAVAHVKDYDPLHDKAQAFELAERLRIGISPPSVDGGLWGANGDYGGCIGDTLARAIVECAAKMQAAKK